MLVRPALLLLALSLASAPLVAGNNVSVLWPDGSGHVHGDPLQHAGLGFGMTLLSYLSLGQSIGEVDVKTDPVTGKTWVLVALLNGGFALVDGSDPANPVLASKAAGGGYGADAKLADDTNTVFLSLQGGGQGCDLPQDLNPLMVPIPRKLQCGAQVWDTSDKTKPAFLVTLPSSTGGSHMMDYEVLNGVPTIAMAAQGSPNSVPIAVVGANKVPVSVGRAEAGSNHDVTLTMDPLMPGRALGLVANAYSGVRVFDITAPSLPLELGHWTPSPARYVHTVMLTVVEGKRILVAEEESFSGGSIPSQLYFLDATDFGNMQLLRTWTNPDGKLPCCFVRWSTHDFNIQDGKLYLAHYHGGVLVLDISTLAKVASPPLLANYLPAKPRVSGAFSSDIPYTWDALPHKGVVWATDINTGLYALRLDA